MSARYWIDKLGLSKHPEGGWYKRVHTSEKVQSTDRGDRSQLTAIYYLLEAQDYSAWHRIQSEELWAWHAGDPLAILTLTGEQVDTTTLGVDAMQHTVPGKHWFAAQLAHAQHGFSLVSCVVSPGFEFADFELAEREDIPSAWHTLLRS